jgi:phosphinothricin acetyltransferase
MEKKQEKGFMNISQTEIQIRPAILSDVPAITEIYNEAVLNGVATFDTEIKSLEDRSKWFQLRAENNPIIVAIVSDDVVGWASLNAWSERAAYDKTAEVSIYVHKDFRAKGIGRVLFKTLLNKAEEVDLHYLLARITEGNQISIDLHLKNGFTIIGVMHQVGYKFGKFLDVTLMEKLINKH